MDVKLGSLPNAWAGLSWLGRLGRNAYAGRIRTGGWRWWCGFSSLDRYGLRDMRLRGPVPPRLQPLAQVGGTIRVQQSTECRSVYRREFARVAGIALRGGIPVDTPDMASHGWSSVGWRRGLFLPGRLHSSCTYEVAMQSCVCVPRSCSGSLNHAPTPNMLWLVASILTYMSI